MLLIFKLLTTPFFIGAITLLEKKWGTWIAGLLGGFPVIAGPIIAFLAIENGWAFATSAAISAMSSIICLLCFGVSYCWLSKKFKWYIAYSISLIAWLLSAVFFANASPPLLIALPLSCALLMLAPYALPNTKESIGDQNISTNLLPRMISGALLTLSITSLSIFIGPAWSGILSMFPVIGSVLAIFIHRSKGANKVSEMYSGMFKGLYSSLFYFFALAIFLPITSISLAIVIGIAASILVQIILQYKNIIKRFAKF